MNSSLTTRLRLAEAELGVLDTGVLGRAAQRIAFFDRDLVVGVALVLLGLPAGLGLFGRRIFARVGGDHIGFGVRLGPDALRIRLLDAHVLGVTRERVASLLGDAVGRFGACV